MVVDGGGTGGCCQLVAEWGTHDRPYAAAPSIAIAHRRVPSKRFDVGDLPFRPWADDASVVITGPNGFHHAAHPIAAPRETRRIARPGAAVSDRIWSREERTKLMALQLAPCPLLPLTLAGAPGRSRSRTWGW